jgi:integrase
MRHFNLYRRGNVFYCRFKDETTGKYLSGISTGETDERAAMATVALWERDGIDTRDGRTVESVTGTKRLIDLLRTAEIGPTDAAAIVDVLRDRGFVTTATLTGAVQSEPFIDFLTRFWDWKSSPYVKEKRSRGQSIGKRRCEEMGYRIAKYWKPGFPSTVLLSELTRPMLRDFADNLADHDISNQTRNHILNAGFIALRWATLNGVIPSDPSDGLPLYATDAKKRGILDTDELRALFAIDWPDPRAKLAAQIALVTGARAGEIAALTADDVGDDALTIRRSFSPRSGLKGTKTGKERRVPLPGWLRDSIRSHAVKNPQGPGFVFWTADPARPIDPKIFTMGLRDALAVLNTDAETVRAAKRAHQNASHGRKVDDADAAARKRVDDVLSRYRERRVDFHSFRHSFAARLADRVDMRIVQHGTGHATASMAAHYANHQSAERFRELADASRLAFSFVEPGAPAEAAQ